MDKKPFSHKPGFGSLFRNSKKKEGSNAPDYTGNGTTQDGSIIEFSGWIKEGKKGSYLSISIKPEWQNGQAANQDNSVGF